MMRTLTLMVVLILAGACAKSFRGISLKARAK